MKIQMNSQESEESTRTTNSWFFVGNVGDFGVRYFEGSEVGDVVGWRHGNDNYTLQMRPGDAAVIYVSDGKNARITGLGIVLAVREPFLLDTRPYTDTRAYIQRIPILITELFEDRPIDVSNLKDGTAEKLVKGQGSIHPVSSVTNQHLVGRLSAIGLEENALTISVEQKARLVEKSRLLQYLETSNSLVFLNTYVSRNQRKLLYERSETPPDDLSATAVKSRMADIWEKLWDVDVGRAVANLDPIPDNPESSGANDRLNRYPMAEILALRLQTVFANSKSPGKDVDTAPFTLLVDSPWGGGKTTFANFLAQVLATTERTSEFARSLDQKNDSWTIVTLNAWRHQHVKPIWWVLSNYVLYAMLARHCKNKAYFSATRLWISHKAWQLTTWQNAVAFGASFIAFTVAVWLFRNERLGGDGIVLPGSDDPLGAVGWIAVAAVSFVAGLRKLVVAVAHNFNPGRASAEMNYSLGLSDPLERFRRHFRRTLASEGKPILLIIDDLDRCQSDFVVDLVQGLQTLLRSPYFFVLILGDRKWIEKCFDVEFEAMEDKTAKDGTDGIGRKYVEKALQMSLTLPRPTASQSERLLGSLTALAPDPHTNLESKITTRESETGVNGSTTSDSPNSGTTTQTNTSSSNEVPPASGSASREQDDWEKARAHATSLKNDDAIRRTVLKSAGLFPNNPRQMKRTVNTISFYQAIAIGLGKLRPRDDAWEKFFVWIIAYLEFNDQWTKLSRNPELLAVIHGETKSPEFDGDFIKLMKLQSVMDVGNDQKVVKITAADIAAFSEIIPPR